MEIYPHQISSNKSSTLYIVLVIMLSSCILLFGAGIILTFCGVNIPFIEMFTEDPAEIHEIASDFIDYDLSPGYREQIAANIFGIGKMVILDNDLMQVFFFLKIPAVVPIGKGQVLHQMIYSLENLGGVNMTYTGEWPATIRGQKVMVQEYQDESDIGPSIHQISATFKGKSGNVLLIIIGPVSSWSQTEIKAFLGSIN